MGKANHSKWLRRAASFLLLRREKGEEKADEYCARFKWRKFNRALDEVRVLVAREMKGKKSE